MRNESGQALIEIAAFFMVLSVLLAGLAGFTQWITVRERLLLAAEEGAMLYSSGHLERKVVDQEVRRFLASGMPDLPSDRIQILFQQPPGFFGELYELDKITVRYTRPQGWYALLGVDPTIEEFCVIKHAPHYYAPFQTLGGPYIPWKG